MSVRLMINCKRTLDGASIGYFKNIQKRYLSYEEITQKRNQLFDNEMKRQTESIGRIEKIEVRYLGLPENETLIMNKNISTPYNCAQHFTEAVCNNAALALINGQKLWDIHRPLTESCTLQLLNFKISDPYEVNKAFWRTCSFVLGAILQKTFKENTGLFLHSFPKPSLRSGSFIHDFSLNESNWKPSIQELRTLGIEMLKFSTQNYKIERLDIDHDIGLKMFEDNPYKREQLPNIANQNNGTVTVYRVGDHIDISRGPMIASTSFIHKVKISSVHKISKEEDTSNLYRIQGIALPTGFTMSFYAFNILHERAKKLNNARLPFENTVSDLSDEHNSSRNQPVLQRRI